MPKQVFTINDFSGGLVTDKSDRALEPNELAECTNFDVSSKGKIVTSRIFKQTTLYGEGDSTGAETDPGYGLTTFSNDFLSAVPETVNIGEFIVFTGDDNELDLLEVTTTGTDSDAWDQDILTASSYPVGERQAFYAAEGDLFVGGTDNSSPPRFITPTSYVFHKQLQIPTWTHDVGSGQTNHTSGLSDGATTSVYHIIHASSSAITVGAKITGTGIADNTYITKLVDSTHSHINKAPTGTATGLTFSFYGIGVHKWSAGTQDKPAPSASAPGQKIYQSAAAGTSNTTLSSAADIMHWVIKPSGSGLWTNDQSDTSAVHEFMGTWLYKNDVESDMFALDTGNTMTGAGDFGLTDATGLYVQAW